MLTFCIQFRTLSSPWSAISQIDIQKVMNSIPLAVDDLCSVLVTLWLWFCSGLPLLSEWSGIALANVNPFRYAMPMIDFLGLT